MDEKKPVSDEVKAAAAKKAAAARKAAEAKKAGATREAPEKKAAPKKEAPKKKPPKREEPDEEETEAVEEEPEEEEAVEEAPEKKKRLEKPVTDDERKQVKGLRIGAIVLWVLAFACEVGAFFALRFAAMNNVLTQSPINWTAPEMLLLIGLIVLDAVLCVIAAQLWKKSNRISPCLASSKLVRTLWHQLGVIMALVCLVPIGIILLIKTKNMDKRARTILLVAFAVLFAAVTTSSVDFKQPSEEKVQELQQEAEAANADAEVYWTRYGKSYHFSRDCSHIRNKTLVEEGGTLSEGSLQDAFDANRWDPCDECAGGADAAASEADTGDTGEELVEPEEPAA